MYQALYRKYRPTNFNEVIGQTVIIKSLKNAIEQNKLSHAYLFCGPRGTGKTTIAKIIGKTVNCEKPINAIPCNNCVNCTQINNKESTDIIEIDAASNNGVDEIRELKSKVNLVPSSGKYKVYIIDEVHMLTVGAFNALLKTLEEPPAHVLFILATTEPHKIPATILSRCQRFDFKKLSITDLSQRLSFIAEQENIDIEKEALIEIARLSDGGVRDAISLLDQVISYVDINQKITVVDVHEMNGTVSQMDLQKMIESIFSHDILNVFNEFDRYNDNGKNLIKITEEILLFLRNVLLFQTVPHYFDEKDIDVVPYENSSKNVQIEDVVQMIDALNDCISKMKASSNPKMIFELTIIKIISEKNKKKVQPEIVEKVENKRILQEKKEDHIENKSVQTVQTRMKKDSKEKLEKIKQIRINNTLAQFQRKKLLEMKEKMDDFRPLLLNPDYNESATLIIDGEMKAASDTHVVLVYEKEWVSDTFNQKLLQIEKLFEEVYGNPIKAISCCAQEWEHIKIAFNTKKEKYEFQEEKFSLHDLLEEPTVKTEIEEVFSDIIEYSN